MLGFIGRERLSPASSLTPRHAVVVPDWNDFMCGGDEYGTNITAGMASIGVYVLAMEIPSLTGPKPVWTASESSTWAAMHYRGLSTNGGSS